MHTTFTTRFFRKHHNKSKPHSNSATLLGHNVLYMCLPNPLNAKLNPICQLLALLGAHPILHVSRIRVKQHAMQYGGRLTSALHTGVWSNSSSGRFIAGTHCTDGGQDHRDSLGTVSKGQLIYLSSLGTNSTPSALYTAQTKMWLVLSPRSVYAFKAVIIKQRGNFSFNSSEALHPSKEANI